MIRTLMEEMNKWMVEATKAELHEMIETLTEMCFDKCRHDIDKSEVIQIFTHAKEE